MVNKRGKNILLIYLLLLLLLLLWLISYISTKKDILSPPSVFCGIFIVSILFAIPNLEKWNFDMGERTFFVVFLGILFFCIGYFLFYNGKKLFNKQLILQDYEVKKVVIPEYKVMIFSFLQLMTIYFIYITLNEYPGNTIFEKILSYRLSILDSSGYDNKFPTYIMSLYSFCYTGTQVIIYILINNFDIDKKVKGLYVINIFFIIIMSFMFGNRTQVMSIIVYFIIIMYIYYLRKNMWYVQIKLKTYIKILVMLILLLILFPTVGMFLVGRGDDNYFSQADIINLVWDQLSIYIGAPLKLLDLYLYTDYGMNYNFPIAFATFKEFYIWIGLKLNILSWVNITEYGGFRYDNGISLGNVYTTFLNFFVDFGFIGVIVFSFIMGCIMAYVFIKVKYKSSIKNSKIDFYLIIYAYIFSEFIFSFFTNRVFSLIFSYPFVKMLISIMIFSYLFVEKKDKRRNFNEYV